ncbi:MAG TPA: 5-formyltetrahydrofolate cyclo-ligase [Marmoricola sp.]|jgi:5-formyltetrahydrofolate cyclo-ligase|nr:5-formyltetrahydrofolate cyclo-ligase [Marmoricola sp.]
MIHIEAAKLALRDQLVTARGRLPLSEIGDRARAVAALLLDVPEVRRAATVASYVSVGREPGTGPLLDALTGQGKRVILPLLQPDNDLDWAPYQGPGSLLPASRGLLEPAAPPLGPEAIATADVVIMPGLAVDRTGLRLGRGGGSYDRALGRVPVGTFTCVLLNAAEVLDEVPAAPHDRRVTAAATELGLTRF